MDEIEYKLNTKNTVLIVNAIEKLISTVKSKYKPCDRKKFVMENEELKFLREKCSAKDTVVSLTACQGLLALVELGVLEIAHTMSTIITLLPSAHNYTAIISSMAGLLILDLKSRLVPGQPYKCQFTLRSPQHPFITVLEKNKGADDDVLTQMHALCTNPDYIVSSNSLELLRPVFLWLSCNPHHAGVRHWQLLLSLQPSAEQFSLLQSCLSCQRFTDAQSTERAYSAYSTVIEAALYRKDRHYVTAALPMLARISNELIRQGRDPRPCYSLLDRCLSLPLNVGVAGLLLSLLAENLPITAALYLHPLLNLALNIVTQYDYSKLSLNTFVGLSLQWLHLPSYLTSSALKVASQIVDIYRNDSKSDTILHIANLNSNEIYRAFLNTDKQLFLLSKSLETWERFHDNPEKLRSWFDGIEAVDDELKLNLLPFLIGVVMQRREDWFDDVVVRSLKMMVGMVEKRKEVSVTLMPVLMYKLANNSSPNVRMECLRSLPLMAKTKENVPKIVSVLNKLKAGKGVPTSCLVMLYTSLAEAQVRCFPYLHTLLVEAVPVRDEAKWEVELAKAASVERICEIRPGTHGLELVSVISGILNAGGAEAYGARRGALRALRTLWRAAALRAPPAWRQLRGRAPAHTPLQPSVCELLSEVPSLRVDTPEYDQLIAEATKLLWSYIAESNDPKTVEAACDSLANFKVDDYKLKDVPEMYRRTVKLPPSYCKTPADAARKPEDVLDYIPCEIWPEVFKYTNQAAIAGVQRLAIKLMDREVRGYRSGVYRLDSQAEPHDLGYLPASSPVRGLLECCRKQIMYPSYEFPDSVLLAILEALGAEFSRPLPPLDACFLTSLGSRGAAWREAALRLAGRRASSSTSARRIVDTYLMDATNEDTDEAEILTLFELLPILCRGMPPESLRGLLQKYLSKAYEDISHLNVKELDDDEPPAFLRYLKNIQQCLECEKINDANRTLLSQYVENYFTVIPEDNIAWPTYTDVCCALPTSFIERMTSPLSWWETSDELLRKATAVRTKLVATSGLSCLDEMIDAQATQFLDQGYYLESMLPALQAVNPDDDTTKQWFLQLMARTQVAFNESGELSAKLYLFDALVVCVCVWSGLWGVCVRASEGTGLRAGFGGTGPGTLLLRALLPAASAALLAREQWRDCTVQLLEWLCHSRDSIGDESAADSCQQALLALRHYPQFVERRIWTRLESYFAKSPTHLEA